MKVDETIKEERHFSLCLLYDKRKRFLLQLRPKHRTFLPHYWCFFGGRVQQGETPYEALKRKAKDELGFAIKKPKYILSSTFEHANFRSHLHIFAERYKSHGDKLTLKDGENWGWFDVSQLDTIKMQEHDKDLIRYVNIWLESLKERDISIVIMYDGKNKILLQKRSADRKFLPGHWSFFGGGVDAGESDREALVREALEELNYKIKNPILIMKTSFQHPEQRSNMSIYIEKCTNKKGLKLQEGQDWGWFGENEIEELTMLESDKYILSYVFEYLKYQKNRTLRLKNKEKGKKSEDG